MKSPTLTDQARSFIRNHPSIRDCLARGLINHSALARLICAERKLDNFGAVLAATKRLARGKAKPSNEHKIMALIAAAQVRVTNKIAIVVVQTPRDFSTLLALQSNIRKARGRFNLIDGDEVVTLILSQQHLETVKATLRSSIHSIVRDLAQINLIFDSEIETTPGVVAYFYGLLAQHGINIREEMSCWTDIIVVLDEKDVRTALGLLRIE